MEFNSGDDNVIDEMWESSQKMNKIFIIHTCIALNCIQDNTKILEYQPVSDMYNLRQSAIEVTVKWFQLS